MKVGIIGLPQTGKKTLFKILTGIEITDVTRTFKPVPGTAEIIDSRFNFLVDMYLPKKEVKARLDLVLLPKIEADIIAQGDIFKDIADVDAICHVVRGFEDESIYHPNGSVDMHRDFETINAELIMHDQIFVEKRIEKLTAMLKKLKDETREKELILMHQLKQHLEEELPLRLISIFETEEKMIRSYPLITRKKMVIALNVSEDDLKSGSIPERLKEYCSAQAIEIMIVSAKVEAEIAALETEEEKKEFLEALGIKETALEMLTSLCLKSLNLISFFTVGKDEVRQWLVKKDSKAPKAAGIIHSDLERGFIRAEVFKYIDLKKFGSQAELKKSGKFYVEGKEYVVEDGDILNIRFAV